MSRKQAEPEKRRPLAGSAWLPTFFAILFSAIGLYVAFFELSPAFEEHRAVRAALREQLDAKEKLDVEIAEKEKKDLSLEQDPQAIYQELDRRDLLNGEARPGTSSKGLDRGQSRD